MLCPECGNNRSRSSNGGPSVCTECGYRHPERPWTWKHGDRVQVAPDMRDEFNKSLGMPVSSRRDMREKCKVLGVRPVEDGEASTDEGEIRHKIEAHDAAVRERIRNPKCGPLKDHMYEMFQTPAVGQEIRCPDSASEGSSRTEPKKGASRSSARSTSKPSKKASASSTS